MEQVILKQSNQMKSKQKSRKSVNFLKPSHDEAIQNHYKTQKITPSDKQLKNENAYANITGVSQSLLQKHNEALQRYLSSGEKKGQSIIEDEFIKPHRVPIENPDRDGLENPFDVIVGEKGELKVPDQDPQVVNIAEYELKSIEAYTKTSFTSSVPEVNQNIPKPAQGFERPQLSNIDSNTVKE